MSTPDDFATIADALYAGPMDGFIAARDQAARQARERGDAGLAKELGKLRKPTNTGWVLNQLTRQHRKALDALVKLGAQMREATAALDAGKLRELSAKQRKQIEVLVAAARSVAEGGGYKFADALSRGVEDTLYAATADPDSAAQVVQGRLTGPLARSGFPGLDVFAAPAPAAAAKPQRKAGTKVRESGELREAREDLTRATAEAEAATRRKEAAHQAVSEASGATQQAKELMDRLARELDEAAEQHSDLHRSLRSAQQAATAADREAATAVRRMAAAQTQVDRLGG